MKRKRGYSTLCRYLRFPKKANPDVVETRLVNGVLHIQMNKKNTHKAWNAGSCAITNKLMNDFSNEIER